MKAVAHRLGLRRYIEGEIASDEVGIFPPPAELAAWLDQNRAAVAHVVDVLETDPLPEWHLPDSAPNEVVGHLLSFITVNRVLLMSSLDAASRGDDGAALRALDAAWRLRGSIQDTRSSIVVANARLLGTEQAGVLRRLRHVPDEWLARLDELAVGEDVPSCSGYAAVTLLQADLTRATLLARRAPVDAALDDVTHDGSCPGWAWRVDRSVPGWVEVQFVGKLPWSAADAPKKQRPLIHREPVGL